MTSSIRGDLPQQDTVGEDALLAFSEAPRFNQWLYRKIEPYVGHRIIEIGAGIGNLTGYIRAETVIATDYSDRYLNVLRGKYVSAAHITIDRFDLSGDDPTRFSSEQIDTVICLNVLEHVEDDDAGVRLMRDVLSPGGRLLLLVPYSQALYCNYDKQLGHFRRYTRTSVRDVVSRNGFTVERVFLFNFFGGLGWYVTGKIFHKSHLNPGSVRAFERFVPLFQRIEFFGTPFGASVICIARKDGMPTIF
jgi:SAM-dependent methyltransferase